MAKSLRSSVGRMGGRNDPFDVINVQLMLNQVPVAEGGPPVKLAVDGACGSRTIERIQKFQLAHFGWSGADGRVDPNGQTHKKLNEFDDRGPTAPPPLTLRSTIVCLHGGQVVSTSTRNAVVLHRNDVFLVASCPTPSPCVRVEWVASTPSGHLDSTSVGLGLDATNVVRGPVRIVKP